ncbi:MAG TPA: lysine--tRNA ligase [Smithellaceae bacterium]|jgi:lysyl-tRNA synthetase class 2|nr:lysine--tRNA ligase [Syntrophaceae bacterium]NMC91546.1 lysine--tRNA ligase [Smithella sp.]HNV57711.1 lysine--tRNA ligase [Smithellaceae bacterium]HNY96849.1 lysine--tRNA ligase [Smithellaceae bacterium]HOD64878.1 lysine--tRNA ligase [Smithellaceae bacterium]
MEDNDLLKVRLEKIAALKAAGVDLYPNDAKPQNTTAQIFDEFGQMESETLAQLPQKFSLAGRLMAVRSFGKAAFVKIQDRKGQMQCYLAKNILSEQDFSLFKKLDIGDIVYVSGKLFRTKTNELTLEAESLRLMAKSIHPLPEKWHGLTDIETRYRQRHLDLISNPAVKEIFIRRSLIIKLMRQFMDRHDFLEVETPMMQPKAGGAVARPFKTHHNALNQDFYLRIAPELYLKRLVTGGLERVYEINRNFRNEGISTFHNPEFTMMEFYQSYATYEDLMSLTEELFCFIAENVFGGLKFTYQGTEIDLTPPWRRLSVRDALIQIAQMAPDELTDPGRAIAFARKTGCDVKETDPPGKILMAVFDELVEKKLVQPTFVTHYPVAVSPLSRRSSADPDIVDRFELYISGREIANAFSELNDPADQRERFLAQIRQREAGDDEAHEMDEDYIRTLEYGMPPTAGEGIGIDRLIMLFTDSASIRDVILFPLLRNKQE